MKTSTLILSIFAICVIQAVFAESTGCSKSCFEGCSFGICKQTTDCMGCSRKYYNDKMNAKTKIKLMKKLIESFLFKFTIEYL